MKYRKTQMKIAQGQSLNQLEKSDACAGCPNQEACATAPKGPDPDLVSIVERMATVKHKILDLSGKGSAQLSFALSAMDFQVGILDIDICGPSIPKCSVWKDKRYIRVTSDGPLFTWTQTLGSCRLDSCSRALMKPS